LRLAWANSLRDFISKVTGEKWAGGLTQAVEFELEVLSSNTSVFYHYKEVPEVG
jgi:hypothetical protein